MASDASSQQRVRDYRYVAFCDILGFSNQIMNDFEKALNSYRKFAESLAGLGVGDDVQVTMYSDAILLTGTTLSKVLAAVQAVWFMALCRDLMIRGAVTHGQYWEERRGNHLFVVSDALVRAVRLERSVGIPAVVIADDVEIPESYWLARFSQGPLITALLYFRDRNIVNPFNLMWFRSAETRARQLMEANPAHKDKYLWFLALYKAVYDGWVLIPHPVFEKFLRDGVLKPEEVKLIAEEKTRARSEPAPGQSE
jgi:hypothetical protein